MKFKIIIKWVLAGSFVGLFVLHPIIMIFGHLMLEPELFHGHSAAEIISLEFQKSFSMKMIPWSLTFTLLCAFIGFYAGRFKTGKELIVIANEELENRIKERTGESERMNRFFITVIDSLSHPFYIIDTNNYQIIMSNRSAHHGEISKKTTCYALSHNRSAPCNGSEHPCPINEVIKTKTSYATEHVHYDKDGNVRYVEVHAHPIFDSNGNVHQMIEYSLDITDRKLSETMLKESEERLKIVLDSIDAGVIIIDPENHTIVDVNQSAIDLSGASKDQIVGHECHQFICPTEKGKCPITDLGQKVDKTGRIFLNIEKEEFPILKSVVPIKLNGREHLLESFIDLTNIKKAQKENERLEILLRQAQKMEAIGTLAGGIAHDFNNILSAVVGYTELALMKVETENSLKEDLHEVLSASKRAIDLVKQILTFSRQGKDEKQPFQVKLIVKEVLKLLRSSLPTTIEIQENLQSDSLVMGDPTQIHQVLMNLCTNADHAMRNKGGVLDVTLTDVSLEAKFTDKHLDVEPGSYTRLTVSDTGYGMASDVLEKIFDPFFTTKINGEGTGMGLAVVHGIVKNHGGAITVYSEPGEGTTFNIFFPAIEKPVHEEIMVEEAVPTGTEHILLVDDEQPIVSIGKRLLELLGYKVETRTSSIEALELFRTKPDTFDLIISDITMPNLRGDQLAREILNIRPHIPIILCTGFSSTVNQKKARAIGVRAFAHKPFIRKDLAKIIRKVFDEKL